MIESTCKLPSRNKTRYWLYDLLANADATICNKTDWGRKDNSINSSVTWVETCTFGGSPDCSSCDWWPSRSSAAWYYDAAAAPLTCGQYFINGTRFPCDNKAGYYFNSSTVVTTNPSSTVCCYFQATCGLTAPGAGSYKCTQPGMVFDGTSLANYPPNSTNCCKQFVPTCGMADISGASYQCPSDGIAYDLVNPTSTNPSAATCCSFVPTCEAIDTSKTDYVCTTANYVLDPNSLKEREPSNTTCCVKANCAASPSGFFPGVYYNYSSSGYCYYSVCGAALQLDTNSSAVVNVTTFSCPDGYSSNTAASNSTDLSVESCCFRPTCGAVDTSGTPYACPATYTLISSQLAQPVVSNSTLDTASCCYQPTCGAFTYSGVPYQCPGGAYILLDSAYSHPSPDVPTCCVSVSAVIAS